MKLIKIKDPVDKNSKMIFSVVGNKLSPLGIKAIAVAGASYSIAGRSFTRANLAEVAQTIKELQAAIDNASGNRVRRFTPTFPTQRP